MLAIFFVVLFTSPISHAYANEETTTKQQIDDGIKFLEFENHALLPKQVSNFVTIKNKHDELYSSVQSQLPRNAYLLEIYVPQTYKQALDRGYYENVTRMVYLYTMPVLLQGRNNQKKLQLSFILQAIENVFTTYKPLPRPTLKTKLTWENKVYDLFKIGESIYFTYPKMKKGDHIYSALQTFPLTKNLYTGAFLSTHIFTRDSQIYFLSASTFLTENNYYEELMWTRDTLDEFIKLLPEVQNNIVE